MCIMATRYPYLISFAFALVELTIAKNASEYLNVCADALYRKDFPGPEAELFGECAPWKNRSCCTYNTTVAFYNLTSFLNFNYNHCPGHVLSDPCKKRFRQDHCFAECSPNMGPWLQKVSMKTRNERPQNIPLCESTCNNWWNDCINEYTCLDDWGKGFNWTTGTNKCPIGTVCRPFREVFKDASTFCNQIWNFEWQVVPDSQPCMVHQFNGTNPNDAVAQWKANQLANKSKCKYCNNWLMIVLYIMVST